MLYVSRCVGQKKFMVCDTDDGTEEEVTFSKLHGIIKLGIEVKGVEVGTRVVNKTVQTFIKRVEVYQDVGNLTAKQVKLKTLGGIEIKTQGDTITNITWRDEQTKRRVRIRLSDYGTKCADYIIRGGQQWHKVPIILVLDDKIKIRKNTFYGFTHSLAFIDLTEVTDVRTAKFVYEEWIENGSSVSLYDIVADNKERLDRWAVYGVVVHNTVLNGRYFSDEVVRELENRLFDSFKTLAASPLHFVNDSHAREEARLHISRIKRNRAFWRQNCQTYKTVRVFDDLDSLLALGHTTTLNKRVIGYLVAFMNNWEPSDPLKELYVSLVNRANNWFLDLEKEMNWRVQVQ